MIKTVILDYGHGCDTKGKCSPDKRFYEYRFNRRLGYVVKQKLLNVGFAVVETVADDYDVPLKERARRANLCGKSDTLFVSIHANAAGGDGGWHDARGWSVFVSKSASLSSREFATSMAKQAKIIGFKVRVPKPNQLYWEENFTVLTNTAMPAVLVENLFYDNQDDLKLLENEKQIYLLADVIVNGIVAQI